MFRKKNRAAPAITALAPAVVSPAATTASLATAPTPARHPISKTTITTTTRSLATTSSSSPSPAPPTPTVTPPTVITPVMPAVCPGPPVTASTVTVTPPASTPSRTLELGKRKTHVQGSSGPSPTRANVTPAHTAAEAPSLPWVSADIEHHQPKTMCWAQMMSRISMLTMMVAIATR